MHNSAGDWGRLGYRKDDSIRFRAERGQGVYCLTDGSSIEGGASPFIFSRDFSDIEMMHFEKAADEINKMRPGSVHYIVANIGV